MHGFTTTATRLAGFVGLFIVLLLAGAALLRGGAGPAGTDEPRAITLVARDMAFYVEGDDTPNPALRLRAGERIKLILRNEDGGMTHDFAIEAWQVGTRLIEGKGEGTLSFTVPRDATSSEYRCTPHPRTMWGAIIIE